jgi:hypothetical protein
MYARVRRSRSSHCTTYGLSLPPSITYELGNRCRCSHFEAGAGGPLRSLPGVLKKKRRGEEREESHGANFVMLVPPRLAVHVSDSPVSEISRSRCNNSKGRFNSFLPAVFIWRARTSKRLFPSLKHLFFGLGPIIKFGAGLIAALDIEFVSATADAFFERKRLDWGFFCFRGCWHKITSGLKLPQTVSDRKASVHPQRHGKYTGLLALVMFYCKERVQLVKDWRDAVAIFFARVLQLEACRSDQVRFEERYEISISAREVAEHVHALMVSHRAEHGC